MSMSTRLKNFFSEENTEKYKTQAKSALNKTQVVLKEGYETTQKSAMQFLESEKAQEYAAQVLITYNAAQKILADKIGPENVEKMNNQYKGLKNQAVIHYKVARSEYEKLMEREETKQLKAILEHSLDSLLVTKILLFIALKTASPAGATYTVFQCSQHVINTLFFMLQQMQSYEESRKKNVDESKEGSETKIVTESVYDPKEKEFVEVLKEAYAAVKKLHAKKQEVEAYVKEHGLQTEKKVTSDDYKIEEYVPPTNNKDEDFTEAYLRSFFEGALNSASINYFIYFIGSALNAPRSLKVMTMIGVLIYSVGNRLETNIQKMMDDYRLSHDLFYTDQMHAKLMTVKEKSTVKTEAPLTAPETETASASEAQNSKLNLRPLLETMVTTLGLCSILKDAVPNTRVVKATGTATLGAGCLLFFSDRRKYNENRKQALEQMHSQIADIRESIPKLETAHQGQCTELANAKKAVQELNQVESSGPKPETSKLSM